MREIVGASLSQFHDDENSFELLLAFADGREFGHVVSRTAAKNIAAEFAREFDTPAPQPLSVGVLTPEGYVADFIAHGEKSTSKLLPWEQAYQDAGIIEEAANNGYIWIGRDVTCTIEVTPHGRTAAELHRLRQSMSTPSPTELSVGWQTIETAPKDRQRILLWHPSWLHPTIGYWSEAYGVFIEHGTKDQKAGAATQWALLVSPNEQATSSLSDYERGVRAGVEEALQIATDQARLMADLVVEGLPENARQREAMEAALTRFSTSLAHTLAALSASEVEG